MWRVLSSLDGDAWESTENRPRNSCKNYIPGCCMFAGCENVPFRCRRTPWIKTGRKPCRGRPFGLYDELESESNRKVRRSRCGRKSNCHMVFAQPACSDAAVCGRWASQQISRAILMRGAETPYRGGPGDSSRAGRPIECVK